MRLPVEGLVAMLVTLRLRLVVARGGWIPAVQTPSAGSRALVQPYKGSLYSSHQNNRTWERRTFPASADAGRFPVHSEVPPRYHSHELSQS